VRVSSGILQQLLLLGREAFYEHLVDLVKKSLKKGIGRKLLFWDKLLTLLAEVEAIINTRIAHKHMTSRMEKTEFIFPDQTL